MKLVYRFIVTVTMFLCLPTTLLISQEKQEKVVICIDPGHGTRNSRRGAKGEAEITLSVARDLGRQFKAYTNVKVVYTHTRIGQNLGAKNADDDNRLRAQIANNSNAFLFLRLHTDAPYGQAAIYYPQVHPDRTIASESRLISEYIWTQLKTILPASIRRGGVISEAKTAIGAQKGGLLVGSRYSKIPTVTIEMVPMSAAGKVWIQDKKNQKALAEAIILGIFYYSQRFEQNVFCPSKNPSVSHRRVLLVSRW